VRCKSTPGLLQSNSMFMLIPAHYLIRFLLLPVCSIGHPRGTVDAAVAPTTSAVFKVDRDRVSISPCLRILLNTPEGAFLCQPFRFIELILEPGFPRCRCWFLWARDGPWTRRQICPFSVSCPLGVGDARWIPPELPEGISRTLRLNSRHHQWIDNRLLLLQQP
jgi:hypothetical protein